MIYDVLCSVDIQEIVRCGGKIIKRCDGIIYRENFKQSPFRAYLKRIFELRLKYKQEGNKVGDLLVKLQLNSLYGKCVQKDIDTLTHLWKESTLEKRYTKLIKNFENVKSDIYLVEEELEETEVMNKNKKQLKQNNAEQIDEYTKLMPSHLGVFILAHSRRIMNNFILSIDGFKKPEIFYTETDSLYISSKNWNVLIEHGYVGNNLSQGKNDLWKWWYCICFVYMHLK